MRDLGFPVLIRRTASFSRLLQRKNKTKQTNKQTKNKNKIKNKKKTQGGDNMLKMRPRPCVKAMGHDKNDLDPPPCSQILIPKHRPSFTTLQRQWRHVHMS
jgi:hypothetical protein